MENIDRLAVTFMVFVIVLGTLILWEFLGWGAIPVTISITFVASRPIEKGGKWIWQKEDTP